MIIFLLPSSCYLVEQQQRQAYGSYLMNFGIMMYCNSKVEPQPKNTELDELFAGSGSKNLIISASEIFLYSYDALWIHKLWDTSQLPDLPFSRNN
jgi:hypothetical protein